jgi:hypothetical protein
MKTGPLRAISSLSGLLLLLSCSCSPALPEGAEILAGADVAQVTRWCSREGPEAAEATWQPSAADVRAFEAQLAIELPHHVRKVGWLLPSDKAQLQSFPVGFWREYIGIVREGRRSIYGNFGPEPRRPLADPLSEEMTYICDGGPVFFGAEYDLQSKTITHAAFNGPLG